MRPLFLISLLTCLALSVAAQTPKTVVNCWIENGKVNHKKLNTFDGNLILLWLEQQGWKLVGVDPPAGALILSKEIDLDDAARTLFLQKLENLHKK
jgi:hypothetical protein